MWGKEMKWVVGMDYGSGLPVYGRRIPLRLLLDACVCYPPVALTRSRSDRGLDGGN